MEVDMDEDECDNDESPIVVVGDDVVIVTYGFHDVVRTCIGCSLQ
jgi:hypothetical protein